jgi:phage gp16-like protein
MKLLLENWRGYLNEEKISVEDIHSRADELGIPWDDDDKFMRWTKKITDKLHLDDLTDEERTKVYAALEKRGKEDK